jgi:ribosomal protein S18 acetylase RimI-like enzyme
LNLTIKLIKSNELLFLRSKILRNNIDPNDCKFEGDNDLDSYHFGAFISGKIVGAVSLINNKCEKIKIESCYQMRGLCIDSKFQNKGIGKKLVDAVERKLKEKKIKNIWMNARDSAISFYLKLNYTNSDIKYSIGQIGLHYLMHKEL